MMSHCLCLLHRIWNGIGVFCVHGRGDSLDKLGCRAFNVIVAIADIYHNDVALEEILDTILSFSGNGSTLIIGYKRFVFEDDEKTAAYAEKEASFRKLMGDHFHLITSQAMLYPFSERVTAVVWEIQRTPFSSMLQRDFSR